ncbi:MAG: trypsin-like peptidase domain-containing protein [Tepidisphaeraceae bacterium]|jgi:serine protease Do
MNPMRSRFLVVLFAFGAMAAGYFGGRPLLERVEFARAEESVQSTRQELATVEDLSTVFRHVDKVVQPSVVQIDVTKTLHSSDDGQSGPDDQLRKFFQDHGFPDINPPQQDQQEIGTGSGVIMEVDGGYGYVLTNNHVAGDATSIEVELADGRILKNKDVTLLGADPKSDLAVLKIKVDRLIPAVWGNSDELEIGDWVMAFGSPFGYVGSMTHGIVSALKRDNVNIIMGGQGYENFIQVDAPINPGNSGGPLVNIRGEVIGINTAIATRSGGFQGIGFAIPSNQAHDVYTALKEHGSVVRGWLGISLEDVSDNLALAHSFGYTGEQGILVGEVAPNGPVAGLVSPGDIIHGYNGQPVANSHELRVLVASTPPGTKATLQVFRNGADEDVTITVGTQPSDMEAAMDHGGGDDQAASPAESQAVQAIGLTLATLDKDQAAKLGIDSGAVVTDVAHDSIAEKCGMAVGDVITMVFKTPIHSAKDAADALAGGDLNKGIRLYVISRDEQSGHQVSRFVFLQNPDAAQ